jgi:hypothetical protein
LLAEVLIDGDRCVDEAERLLKRHWARHFEACNPDVVPVVDGRTTANPLSSVRHADQRHAMLTRDEPCRPEQGSRLLGVAYDGHSG